MSRKIICILAAALMFVYAMLLSVQVNTPGIVGHVTELIGAEVPTECEVPNDAFGVWQIPEIETVTPIYERSVTNGQDIVDRENSAVIMPLGSGRLIGDHAGSITNGGRGIWHMNYVHVDGRAFLSTDDVTEIYQCYAICRAQSTGYGYTVNGKGISPNGSREIFCVSCANASGSEVYIAMYRYVGTTP